MLSIKEIKHRLPQEFVNNLYEMFSPLTVDKIFVGISEKRYTTLRVNTIKYNIQDLMRYFKEKNIKFERVLWYTDALIIKNANEKDIQKLDIYEKGYIYIQSLSSMVPPIVLNPNPGDKILDMTAAPGSKTTQMACIMKNKGYILANELDKIRCKKLKYNVVSQGTDIIEVINGRGEKLGENYKEQFDKVLLDTPCSGEGRFSMNNVQTYRGWSTKTVKELTKIQKKLFKSAYEALSPNGIMVYSTCTLNEEENENIVNWALENFKLKLINIDLNIKDAIFVCDGKAIKILPSKNMEGFFVAKFQKNDIITKK